MIGFYKYTDKEIKALLRSMVILVDSREQVNDHLLSYWDSKKIKYESMKLDFGDYSFKIPKNDELGIARDLYFDKEMVFERKNSLEEVSGNLTQGRTQFENEFIRSSGAKVHLLIENATYEDIGAHRYKTEYNPMSFLASLHSFQSRYNLDIHFMKDNKQSGQFIYFTFYYFLRNYLLNK